MNQFLYLGIQRMVFTLTALFWAVCQLFCCVFNFQRIDNSGDRKNCDLGGIGQFFIKQINNLSI